jgi:hypothetical protein
MNSLKAYDTITVLEPHHDDFCINMLGTMFDLKAEGTLKALKIVSFFSVGAGISQIPTSVIAPFFSEIKFQVVDLGLTMIMKGGGAEERKKQSTYVKDFLTQFAIVNKTTPWELRDKVIGLCEGLAIGPMGFRHPDHNFLSRLEVAQYFYREYPYYWNRSESFDKRLYEYNVLRLADRYEMDLEMSTFKWNTVSSVYKDVMGTFNPRFMRPYFRNVRSEEIYTAVDKRTTSDVKNCILSDRDYVEERKSTHRCV